MAVLRSARTTPEPSSQPALRRRPSIPAPRSSRGAPALGRTLARGTAASSIAERREATSPSRTAAPPHRGGNETGGAAGQEKASGRRRRGWSGSVVRTPARGFGPRAAYETLRFRTVGLPERISLGRRSRPTRRPRTTAPLQRGHPRTAAGSFRTRVLPARRRFSAPVRAAAGNEANRQAAGQAPIKSKAKIRTAILFIRSFPRSSVQLLQSGGTSFRLWLFSQSEKK
jgi:hypothetical protein